VFQSLPNQGVYCSCPFIKQTLILYTAFVVYSESHKTLD